MLTALSKQDTSRATQPFPAGINMLAQLDIKGSGGLGDLMKAAGLKETVLPIGGTMSPSLFSKKAKSEDKQKGLSLSMALPKMSIPGLPSSMKTSAPKFGISHKVPDQLQKIKDRKPQPATAASSSGQPSAAAKTKAASEELTAAIKALEFCEKQDEKQLSLKQTPS